MSLSVEKIVASAVEILNQYGLADMTMRRLASTLEVAPGALYWHIKNKQELLVAIAEHIIASPAPTDDVVAPEVKDVLSSDATELIAYCAQLRARMLSFRDGAEVVLAALAQPHSPLKEKVTAELTQRVAALGAQDVEANVEALLKHVMGDTLLEQATVQNSVLLEPDRKFDITYQIGCSSGLFLLVRAMTPAGVGKP